MPIQFKTILCLCIFPFFYLPCSAQLETEQFYYGFHTGANFTRISDIQTTLIRPIFPEGSFKVSSQRKWGFSGGASIYYRFKKSKFAIQPSISYNEYGGQFLYEDIEGLNYQLDFNYNYLGISPIVKYYLAAGVNIHIGPQLNLVIDRTRLNYTSNMPDLGPDLQIQQSLREVLKANSIVAFSFGVGYDMPFGLGVDINYILGISDGIETLPNGFYFIENKNPTSGIQIQLSYHIPFYK